MTALGKRTLLTFKSCYMHTRSIVTCVLCMFEYLYVLCKLYTYINCCVCFSVCRCGHMGTCSMHIQTYILSQERRKYACTSSKEKDQAQSLPRSN